MGDNWMGIGMEGDGLVDTEGGMVCELLCGRAGELLSGRRGNVLRRVIDSSIPPATEIPKAWA